MVSLAKEHKDRIALYLRKHEGRLRKELYNGEWDKERKARTTFYRKVFGEEHLDKLTESEFGQAVKELWASLIWTNKNYLVDKIINDNGLSQIRKSLKILLYGDAPLEDRFDIFSETIKGLGTSSITEILSFVSPREYSIWNDKPKNVLPLLGMGGILPSRVFKYQLNGRDYNLCNEVLKQIAAEMEGQGFSDVDLLDVDIFMWLLFLEEVKKEPRPKPLPPPGAGPPKPGAEALAIDPAELGHWDAMAILLDLGNLLGFDTYTADPSKKSDVLNKNLSEIALLKEIPAFTYQRHLDTVKNVDVIWFKDEFPAYCFEVEHTTGVTMGLLRLYQINNFTNAVFFVISPTDVISKFHIETTKDPFFKIKERYIFKSYEELVEFYIEAKKYHEARGKFIGKF
jgi:hypothetical protein